ncbi:MAG: phosphonoacetaldehyde hydrolase [Tannerellaceae bacterium]|jgi:phosphonoacetaldehyde hydrolase|nr:phosphonoacetaldehyde hydrolase [Tannerellaceae bacterium]
MDERKKIKGIICDWAGTVIDFGCIAPVTVFVDVFKKKGIDITWEEARKPMGLSKKAHIQAIMQEPRIITLWQERYGKPSGEEDVDRLYAMVEPQLAEVVKSHCDIIPGAIELLEFCRENGVKFGTTTGYVGSMMRNIIPLVSEKGFIPDCIVASDEVPYGRPSPFMLFENMKRMNRYPASQMVKIGDTVADIQEGLNAGMWTIGLTLSGNETGLTRSQLEALPESEIHELRSKASKRLLKAGAHYTCDGIWSVLPILRGINEKGSITNRMDDW